MNAGHCGASMSEYTDAIVEHKCKGADQEMPLSICYSSLTPLQQNVHGTSAFCFELNVP